MAAFYGGVHGNRGPATRLGSPKSGLTTFAASWAGRVNVSLSERDGVDYAHVELAPHHGHGIHKVLYDGPVGGPKDTKSV